MRDQKTETRNQKTLSNGKSVFPAVSHFIYAAIWIGAIFAPEDHGVLFVLLIMLALHLANMLRHSARYFVFFSLRGYNVPLSALSESDKASLLQKLGILLIIVTVICDPTLGGFGGVQQTLQDIAQRPFFPIGMLSLQLSIVWKDVQSHRKNAAETTEGTKAPSDARPSR
jgi:hypothetical protein